MTEIGDDHDVAKQATGRERGGLRILLTNHTLGARAGSELYLRDLAIGLMKRGHFPVAYSPVLGEVAAELARATVPVIDDLDMLTEPPDIIHGQHHLPTMTAVLRFPLTPSLFVCHGWLPWEEKPPLFPSIRHYVAVDDLCRERLLTTKGIAPDSVSVIRNFVDMSRFPQRAEWRSEPQSALIFSNYSAPGDPRSTVIRAACARAGITRVDLVGVGAGNSHPRPEQLLLEYDVVFAKARSAMEAMASGAAVIIADYAGLGGMVSSDHVQHLRRWNFGARTMQAASITEDLVLSELQRYDASDARRVSDIIRSEADMELAIDQWISTYRKVIAGNPAPAAHDTASFLKAELAAASRYIQAHASLIKGLSDAETRAHIATAARQETTELLVTANAQIAALGASSAATAAELADLRNELAARQEEIVAYGNELAAAIAETADKQAQEETIATLQAELTLKNAALEAISASRVGIFRRLFRRIKARSIRSTS